MRQHLSTTALSLLAELFHELVELDGIIATDMRSRSASSCGKRNI
jgi:hypothetical protein